MSHPWGARPTRRAGRLACAAIVLAAGCSGTAADPTPTRTSTTTTPTATSTSSPTPTDGGDTPGPDTDPQQGRVTPELVDLDPCALLTDAEVAAFAGGDVTAAEGPQPTTEVRQCTWNSADGPVLTVRETARAEDLVATLDAIVSTTSVEEILGLPGTAVLAVDGDGAPGTAGRPALGVAVDLGDGFHLTVVPASPLEIATDAWERYLDLIRSAARRIVP